MQRPLRIAAASLIDSVLFYSLLVVMLLVAIPYGTVEPWWKALFQCLVFVLAGLAVIEKWLRIKTGSHDSATSLAGYQHGETPLLLPALALIVFALTQTIPWSSYSIGGTGSSPITLSADPFQTRLFAIQLSALVLMGWLMVLYTYNQRRLYLLIETIIAIGVMCAGFGLWRQASQRQVGFVLPYLRPGFGYGQFINSNHFAFLMEMALGLTLGIVVCRGARGRRLVLYLAAAIPMFVALVLANSRGGILSILCQVIFLAALLVSGRGQAVAGAKTGVSRIKQAVVQVALIAVLLIGGVVTVVFVGGDPLAGRIDSISTEFNRKIADTFTLRRNIWPATWELIKDHPIAGAGFGGYGIAITKYHRASGESTPQEAHNDYLELLASGGLIALSIGIWFVVAFVKLTRCALRTADAPGRAVILGAIIGMLTVSIHSLVDFGLHITINAVVFTTLIALVIIIGKRSTKPISQRA
jgi:O-antigen ligase